MRLVPNGFQKNPVFHFFDLEHGTRVQIENIPNGLWQDHPSESV